MIIGLEALRIFKAQGSLKMREKYPMIYRRDINEKDLNKYAYFNPNKVYLYDSPPNDKPPHTSPWYFLFLIPNRTNDGGDALNLSLYFMQFLNWAIFYYKKLTTDYNSIPRGRPKAQDKTEAKEWADIYANIINVMSGKEYTEDEIIEKANGSFKRNNYPLKPTYFLKLCRFFARAWYEENFSTAENAIGSVKFAHYVSNYIEASQQDEPYICKRYDGNNDNGKKEVSRLFNDNTHYRDTYLGFTIEIEKVDNPKSDPTYTISIFQNHCKHTFYLIARLFLRRYQPVIK